MTSVRIIVPTFNERQNIKELIPKIFEYSTENKIDVEIIVVDDNSSDGTGEVIKDLMKKYPITLIERKSKLGIGSAYIAGFKTVLKNPDSDLICTMDADLSHNPCHLPNFLEKIEEGYDVVLGSRYIKGGGVSWSGWRLVLSKGANLFAKTMLGLNVHDLTTGYRCYRTEALKSIELDAIKSEGYSFLEEILYLCKQKGFKVGETPIFFEDRRDGESKLSRGEIPKFFVTIVRLKVTNILKR